MTRAFCGYADLLRVMDSDESLLPAAAELLGFAFVRPAEEPIPPPGALLPGGIESGTGIPVAPIVVPDGSEQWPKGCADSIFWQPVRYWTYAPLETAPPAVDKNLPLSWKDPETLPARHPVARWRELLPRLRKELLGHTTGSRVDVDEVVKRIARSETIGRVPRELQRRWGSRVQLVVDWSQHLIPFREDQRELCEQIAQIYGTANVDLVLYDESRNRLCSRTDARRQDYRFLDDTVPVVVLSDFGAALPDASRPLTNWLPWSAQLVERGICAVAVVPCDPRRVHRAIRSSMRVLSWQTPVHYRKFENEEERRRAVRLMLSTLAYATLIEPGLLRAIRRDVLGLSDASLESEFWRSDFLQSRHRAAAALDPIIAKEVLVRQFSELTRQQRQEALAVIRQWRHAKSDEVWIGEIWKMDPESRALVPARDTQIADRRLAMLAEELPRTGQSLGIDERAWVARATESLSDEVLARVKLLRELYQLSHPEETDRLLPGAHPSEVAPRIRHTLRIAQRGSQLVFSHSSSNSTDGGYLGTIDSTNDWVTVESLTPDRNAFWKAGRAPGWARNWGRDEYGAWAEFEIEPNSELPVEEDPAGSPAVRQRLRWIPPGSFLMGSPEDEPGRYDDEGPQHPVTLTRGFWMFDTPVTQRLWRAVVGDNPSKSQGELRPAENVSWDDAQRFLAALNKRLGEPEFGLPTEAQWEYACRAGTTTAWCFGDDPAALGDHAWYRENSDNQTHPVAAKQPNTWGLFDMYGNVLEWCQDYWADSYVGAQTFDPQGPKTGRLQVVRGGGWSLYAQGLRSASRYGSLTGYRDGHVGFRCAQVQAGAEPAEEDGAAAEPRARPTNDGGAVAIKIDFQQPARVRLPKTSGIVVRSDVDCLELRKLPKPDWASAIGRDRYGLWAEFTIPAANAAPPPPPKMKRRKRGREPTASTAPATVGRDVVQRMRWIPPGRFLMGSPDSDDQAYDDEKPQHEVTLRYGYWLFDTPVTQRLWRALMGDNPSQFQGELRPVENVSWNDAQRFLAALNQRLGEPVFGLPSEAQWEYACRAGTTTAWYFGDDPAALGKHAWYWDNSDKQTHPVGDKQPNAWGLYDMHGNVFEWCQDYWADNYVGAETLDPQDHFRVLRGGSWYIAARLVRSAFRLGRDPGFRYDGIGFRCAQVQPASRWREQASEGTSKERDATPPGRSE